MPLAMRGGIPVIQTLTVSTTGTEYRPRMPTSAIQVINNGAVDVRLYFSLADFTANTNYLIVPAGGGTFSGPAELWPMSASQQAVNQAATNRGGVWLRTETGTSLVSAVFYERRG